jgi:uncharacterized membrane protein YqjE
MDDTDRLARGAPNEDARSDPAAQGIGREPPPADAPLSPDVQFEEGLVEEISHLIDDSVTYAQAEIAFQKSRIGFVGGAAGKAAIYVVVALVLFHIALLALAVGLVIALAPLVTIWGAIAIVVGVLLLGVVFLLLRARKVASRLSAAFSSGSADKRSTA